jgi:hypothetical protein
MTFPMMTTSSFEPSVRSEKGTSAVQFIKLFLKAKVMMLMIRCHDTQHNNISDCGKIGVLPYGLRDVGLKDSSANLCANIN